MEWARSAKGRPEISVLGKIHQYTTVKGTASSLSLPETHSHLHIKEVKSTDPKNNKGWKIKLSRIG
jgi:hypothetical protein